MLKKWILVTLFLSSALSLQALEKVNPSKIQENPPIVVEPDQTDIYAIPLDEDAEDQQDELYELEHPKK